MPLEIQPKRARIAELDDRMSAPDFWDNPEKAQVVQKERTSLDNAVRKFAQARKGVADLRELLEMAADPSLRGRLSIATTRSRKVAVASEFMRT